MELSDTEGSLFATLMPVIMFYCTGIAYILIQTGNLLTLPLALAAFAAVVLPGMLFIGAFSLACPAIIRVPVYQFLFVGYWFWGNLFPPGTALPTLSSTILTPIGGYAASGFFGAPFLANTSNQIPPATVLQGVESILLLLAISVLVMKIYIMKNGRLLFQGTTQNLVNETRGKVWMVTTNGSKPEGDFTIVSTLNMGAMMQYRVVGEVASLAGVVSTEPSLEDGYVWLMREQRAITPSVIS